jgi:rhodanese-related sulfurtransferase
MSDFSTIDAQTLAGLLARGEAFELVDVRNPDEVVRGVIEGARHIPLGVLPQRFEELGRDRPVRRALDAGKRIPVRARLAAGFEPRRRSDGLGAQRTSVAGAGTKGRRVGSNGSSQHDFT